MKKKKKTRKVIILKIKVYGFFIIRNHPDNKTNPNFKMHTYIYTIFYWYSSMDNNTNLHQFWMNNQLDFNHWKMKQEVLKEKIL